MATSPVPDRVDDVIEPLGVTFRNPAPLHLFHNKTEPVGFVSFGRPTDEGVTFTAEIPTVVEEGEVKKLTDKAAHFVKYGLIRAVSIGFRPLGDAVERLKTGGLRFLKTEILELSLVSVPAHQDATIQTVKSLCAEGDAATGEIPSAHSSPVGDARRVALSRSGRTMKTTSEQITSFETERRTKAEAMNAIMVKSGEDGTTLDGEQQSKYDDLAAEVESIDKHIARLRKHEELMRVTAVPASGTGTVDAAAARTPASVTSSALPIIQVKSPLPAGHELARALMCQANAVFAMRKGMLVSAVDFAKHHYPDYPRIQEYLQKAAVPAGTTTQAVWAAPLVDPTNLASEFIDFLRPQTIIGRIPGFTMIPFNVRVVAQTSGGNGYWVGEGAPKPLTSFAFQAITHPYHKVAAISVITQELARFSSPSAEALVRNGLAGAIIQRMDEDFIDPTQAAVSGVQPASITNGLTALSSAGSSADNIRTDIQNLIEQYLSANQNVSGLVLIMPNTLALAASILVNSLGQREFPDLTPSGGSLLGIPVITSQYAANASGGGNLVIAVNAPDIFLSDDGQVNIDASGETSLQMLDNPTNNSATANPTTVVSMFQTNSLAIRAERFITWTKRRAEAVVYMDDVNWGSIGSPS